MTRDEGISVESVFEFTSLFGEGRRTVILRVPRRRHRRERVESFDFFGLRLVLTQDPPEPSRL